MLPATAGFINSKSTGLGEDLIIFNASSMVAFFTGFPATPTNISPGDKVGNVEAALPSLIVAIKTTKLPFSFFFSSSEIPNGPF